MKIEIKISPENLDLPKEIQDGIPVDKMQDACPIATQDPMINAENKQVAIDNFNYGPSTNPEEACGSCTAYNITPEMLECIGDDSGMVGYCQMYKFMCAADNVCDSYASGGPIEDLAA